MYLLFQPPLYLTQLFHHDEEILKFFKNFALFNTATIQSIFTIGATLVAGLKMAKVYFAVDAKRTCAYFFDPSSIRLPL